MKLTRYDPWRMMDDWRQEMGRVLTPFMHEDDISHVVGEEWVPAVDIKEEEDKYVLHADIPGVKPEDHGEWSPEHPR